VIETHREHGNSKNLTINHHSFKTPATKLPVLIVAIFSCLSKC